MKIRTYWGLSYGHHDAAVVVIRDGKIVFAERSQAKDLNNDVLKSLDSTYPPKQVYIHENKRRDTWRKIKSGDWSRLIVPKPWIPITPTYGNHHLSHAAAGYYTSGFEDALIIVADAIGELESLAVYRAQEGKLHTNPLFVLKYPHSLGLFYSYHVAMIGLRPNRDESVMMRMSRQSTCVEYHKVVNGVFSNAPYFHTQRNFHLYPDVIQDDIEKKWIAASAQHVLEQYFVDLVRHFTRGRKENIVFTGGVAYNSFVVERIQGVNRRSTVYVPSHPGDAGSALGAILQHTHQHTELKDGKIFQK